MRRYTVISHGIYVYIKYAMANKKHKKIRTKVVYVQKCDECVFKYDEKIFL